MAKKENSLEDRARIVVLLRLSASDRLKAKIVTNDYRKAILLLNAHRRGLCNLETDVGVEEVDRQYTCLSEVFWWRLLPYGIWVLLDCVVIFDRNYCPILRLQTGKPPELVHPLEWIQRIEEQRYFYEDAVNPYQDPETAPEILTIADFCELEAEIDYRWKLSNHGRLDHKVWGKKWNRR